MAIDLEGAHQADEVVILQEFARREAPGPIRYRPESARANQLVEIVELQLENCDFELPPGPAGPAGVSATAEYADAPGIKNPQLQLGE